MNIVYAMIVSIGIKAISAVIEIVIQMLLTNGIGVSGYGDYTFFVSLIEGAYFVLFSGSVKLNTFYLSTQATNISRFKRNYVLRFVLPIIAVCIVASLLFSNFYGVTASIILLIYYAAYDRSAVFFSRGKQMTALLGEYMLGRIALLACLLIYLKLGTGTGFMLLIFYGLQYLVMFAWFELNRNQVSDGEQQTEVSMRKLWEYQKSDVANSIISYSPAILQYAFAGAFTAGFTGIISVVKKFVNFISGPTAKVFLPEFSRLYKAGENKKLQASYVMIVRVQMIFIGTIAVILLGFPKLILNLFNADLIEYSTVFSITAFCLLFIASAGPVTGMLQMTGNERICNINQWISIGAMCLTWVLCRTEKMFAVYGLCVQAVTEGVLKYISVSRWFKKPAVPLVDYLILWVPVILVRVFIELTGLNMSAVAMACSVIVIGLLNVLLSLRDPMIKDAMINLVKKFIKKDKNL